MKWQAHISANLPTIHCNQQSEMKMTKGVSSCRGEGCSTWHWNYAGVTATVLLHVYLGQAYAVPEGAASGSCSNSSSGISSSSSTATAAVVEGVDGRSIGVQYVGTWDFDRNHGKRSIIRVRGRIIVAREGDAR